MSRLHPTERIALAGATSLALAAVVYFAQSDSIAQDGPPVGQSTDPAAWGSDHVGQPVPNYVTGDECLFCHRKEIGQTWQQNRHQLTVRPASTEPSAVTALRSILNEQDALPQFVMGHRRSLRFLRRTPAYGTFALHSATWRPAADATQGDLTNPENQHWQEEKFAGRCAGCHTTGVDGKTGRFSAIAIDCYACHGDVTIEHSEDTRLVHLSAARDDSARVVVSICGQCHIRSGKSRSTDRPYANNFVAGDNLFRDLAVDWSKDAIDKLNPIDRHVMHNVRDVAVRGETDMTCLSCHQVHEATSIKHVELEDHGLCAACHNPGEAKSTVGPFDVHGEVCEY